MPDPFPPDITAFLADAGNGDKDAAKRLIVAVYAQLRAAAQLHMANERPGHTLTATAMVHEAQPERVYSLRNRNVTMKRA